MPAAPGAPGIQTSNEPKDIVQLYEVSKTVSGTLAILSLVCERGNDDDDADAVTAAAPTIYTAIHGGGFKRVALQFPDHLLADAPQVLLALQSELSLLGDDGTPPMLFILGDTSYGSCCVDEVSHNLRFKPFYMTPAPSMFSLLTATFHENTPSR